MDLREEILKRQNPYINEILENSSVSLAAEAWVQI